jgi:hypothetical protein
VSVSGSKRVLGNKRGKIIFLFLLTHHSSTPSLKYSSLGTRLSELRLHGPEAERWGVRRTIVSKANQLVKEA